jgi:tRNA threonylcarbamoyladenosine biosynthesis protein TsaB
VVAPVLSAPQDVTPLAADGLRACGNGLREYADAFAGKAFAKDALLDIVPHARELALLAVAALAAGQGVPAAQAQPLYLRNKVAYTSAERQAINMANAAAKAGQGTP